MEYVEFAIPLENGYVNKGDNIAHTMAHIGKTIYGDSDVQLEFLFLDAYNVTTGEVDEYNHPTIEQIETILEDKDSTIDNIREITKYSMSAKDKLITTYELKDNPLFPGSSSYFEVKVYGDKEQISQAREKLKEEGINPSMKFYAKKAWDWVDKNVLLRPEPTPWTYNYPC